MDVFDRLLYELEVEEYLKNGFFVFKYVLVLDFRGLLRLYRLVV